MAVDPTHKSDFPAGSEDRCCAETDNLAQPNLSNAAVAGEAPVQQQEREEEQRQAERERDQQGENGGKEN